jgi:hypothetical protein
MVGVENFPHHPEGTFCHGIKQDAKRFFGRYFFVCAGITLIKMLKGHLLRGQCRKREGKPARASEKQSVVRVLVGKMAIISR